METYYVSVWFFFAGFVFKCTFDVNVLDCVKFFLMVGQDEPNKDKDRDWAKQPHIKPIGSIWYVKDLLGDKSDGKWEDKIGKMFCGHNYWKSSAVTV